jgi:hypothetical protein
MNQQLAMTGQVPKPIVVGGPAVVDTRLQKRGSKLKCGVETGFNSSNSC